MKLNARDITAYVTGKSPPKPVTLVYGADSAETRATIKTMLKNALGPQASEEMRLETFAASDVARDIARLVDAAKSRGFFDGARGIAIYDAGENIRSPLETLLQDIDPSDARVFIQAGSLAKSSKLRQLAEKHNAIATIALYADPLSIAAVDDRIRVAKLNLSPEARDIIVTYARETSPQIFDQLVETLSLYQGNDKTPLDGDVVRDLTPGTDAGPLDLFLAAITDGQGKAVIAYLDKALEHGERPATILIMMARHFSALHKLKTSGDPTNAIGRMRPPVFGPRRDALLRGTRNWPLPAIESALADILALETTLRSGGKHPEGALLTRTALRLALQRPNNR